ncbi:MAG: hypothetical protein ACW98D_17885 [Promethearchaeota archaeon]|jgi:IS1 family transposase
MSERKHGRRYSFKEKRDILDYLEKHTYKETSEKFIISETTLSRWRKEIKSGSKYNRTKIIISLPKFWLEYLNDQIESDVWENYSDAFLSILRDFFRNEKSKQNVDLKYLDKIKGLIPKLLELNPEIDSMLLSSVDEVIYKTERWGSAEGISNLIESWKKAYALLGKYYWYKNKDKSGNLKSFEYKEFEFQNETYHIRDISVKHLIGVKKGQRSNYLLALKRKLTEKDVYILAIAKTTDENSMLLAMNALKRVAMGVLPPRSDKSLETSFEVLKESPSSELKTILQGRKDYVEKAQEIISEDPQIVIKEQTTGLNSLNSRIREKFGDDIVENKGFKKSKNYLKESIANWEKEKETKFKIKTNPFLMRIATLVNISLDFEEKKALETLEKQIGRRIKRLTADSEQYISRNDLMSIRNGKRVQERSLEILPWMHADGNFLALKFPCHYVASNGKIILLTLLNLGLSEIPSAVTHLKNLTYLNLNFNKLTELPKTFSNLNFLEILFVDNNQFTKVPEYLVELSKLENLYMRNNKITKIPTVLTEAWKIRFRDQFDLGYFSSNCTAKLDFTGNLIEYDSLSKDQIELERGFLLDISIPRPFKALSKK